MLAFPGDPCSTWEATLCRTYPETCASVALAVPLLGNLLEVDLKIPRMAPLAELGILGTS